MSTSPQSAPENPPAFPPIHGELIALGQPDEGYFPRALVKCSIEEIHDLPRVPMYRQVVIISAEDYAMLRARAAENKEEGL